MSKSRKLTHGEVTLHISDNDIGLIERELYDFLEKYYLEKFKILLRNLLEETGRSPDQIKTILISIAPTESYNIHNCFANALFSIFEKRSLDPSLPDIIFDENLSFKDQELWCVDAIQVFPTKSFEQFDKLYQKISNDEPSDGVPSLLKLAKNAITKPLFNNLVDNVPEEHYEAILQNIEDNLLKPDEDSETIVPDTGNILHISDSIDLESHKAPKAIKNKCMAMINILLESKLTKVNEIKTILISADPPKDPTILDSFSAVLYDKYFENCPTFKIIFANLHSEDQEIWHNSLMDYFNAGQVEKIIQVPSLVELSKKGVSKHFLEIFAANLKSAPETLRDDLKDEMTKLIRKALKK